VWDDSVCVLRLPPAFDIRGGEAAPVVAFPQAVNDHPLEARA
jgi:hypothetical protein